MDAGALEAFFPSGIQFCGSQSKHGRCLTTRYIALKWAQAVIIYTEDYFCTRLT